MYKAKMVVTRNIENIKITVNNYQKMISDVLWGKEYEWRYQRKTNIIDFLQQFEDDDDDDDGDDDDADDGK